MSKVQFYYMPESPPCRAVEMVASLVNVELEKHYINLFTKDHLKEEYLKVNPQHKVPFIIDGDLKLGESRSIMRYLANKPAGSQLYPLDAKKRAKVDELLDFNIGTIYAAGSKLFRPMFFEGATKLNEQSEKEYREVLEQVETRLKDGRKFLIGDHLTIGDVSVAATLTLPLACGFDFDGYPLLVAYLKRVKESIPKYGEINDKAVENFSNFVKSKKQ